MVFRKERTTLLLYALALVALILGIYGRFKGIGLWSLANDEYHTAKSIEYILDKGVPEFDGGGFYTRGILYQYIQAAIISFFDVARETALRSTNIIFSLLAMPALFLLGRRLLGVAFGVFLVMFFSISIWEIEVARYVRMYAPFQALFLWYVVLLYSVCVDGKKQLFPWLIGVSVIGVFIYEAAIFIILLNFYPLLIRDKLPKLREFIVPITALGLAYLYIATDFRSSGVPSIPIDMIFDLAESKMATIGPFHSPAILIAYIFEHIEWLVVGVLLFITILYKQVSFYREKIINGVELSVFITFFSLLFLNQLLFALIFVFMSGLLGWFKFYHSKRLLKVNALFTVLIILLLSLFYWFSLDKGLLFADDEFNPVKKLLILFLKYPDIYSKIIYEYFIVMPIQFFVILVLLGFGVVRFFLREKINESERLLFFVIFFCLVLMAMLVQPYSSTRYTFFLYPLIFSLAFYVFYTIIQGMRFKISDSAICILIIFLVGALFEDVNIKHLLNIEKPNYNFRTEYNENVAGHFFTRFDYKTPSLYVNEQIKNGDIVFSTMLPVDYYLSKMDYFYMNFNNSEFQAISTFEGKRERWTNAKLFYKKEQVINFFYQRDKTVWLLMRSENFPYQSDLEKELSAKFKHRKVFSGVDKIVNVYKIDPQ